MGADLDQVSRDLALVRSGEADFDTRARLEFALLDLLRDEGLPAFVKRITSLSGHTLRKTEAGAASGGLSPTPIPSATPEVVLLMEEAPDGAVLVVEARLSEHVISVDVRLEAESESGPMPAPEHQAFYARWEHLLGTPDDGLASLAPEDRAIYLVGRLEAEIMNGGLGQYLANTEGVHLTETLGCLTRMGAVRTHRLLEQAVALGAAHPSFLAAWDERSGDFARLDEVLLNDPEDLAALAYFTFLAPS